MVALGGGQLRLPDPCRVVCGAADVAALQRLAPVFRLFVHNQYLVFDARMG